MQFERGTYFDLDSTNLMKSAWVQGGGDTILCIQFLNHSTARFNIPYRLLFYIYSMQCSTYKNTEKRHGIMKRAAPNCSALPSDYL